VSCPKVGSGELLKCDPASNGVECVCVCVCVCVCLGQHPYVLTGIVSTLNHPSIHPFIPHPFVSHLLEADKGFCSNGFCVFVFL